MYAAPIANAVPVLCPRCFCPPRCLNELPGHVSRPLDRDNGRVVREHERERLVEQRQLVLGTARALFARLAACCRVDIAPLVAIRGPIFVHAERE
jgi:hypothetical protein